MTQRDPRLDPQPGDVVRSTITANVSERRVVGRRGNDIDYRPHTPTGRSDVRTCFISTWMEWCRKHAASVNAADHTPASEADVRGK